MRRRAADFRRPARRKVPDVLWLALCSIAVLLFIYILSKGNQIESRPALSKVKCFRLSRFICFGCGKF